MRQSQKTEQADRQRQIGLEDREQTGARSMISGENTLLNGIEFQERVLSRKNLNRAYLRVVGNHGAPGIDDMTVDELLPYLKEHKEELLRKLVSGEYKPKPVRRVEIPKPNGGMRKLGIPTVTDRLVQQAVTQVMSPIFEEVFSDNSFGFRPNRSAHDAVMRCVKLYNQGYHYVIDLDLKAYFDTVNHDMLIKFLEQQVTDRWLLRIIRRFLTSGTMNGKMFERSEKGTPQGGPISPLLANIYLNELDKELTRRGHQFVRYADDCNIFVKSQRAGERVLKSITKFLEKKLKLTVNQEKTKVVPTLRMKFLGFTLGVNKNGAYPYPARQVKERVIQALRKITKRSRGVSLEKVLNEIRIKMRGWLQYYGVGRMKDFTFQLDKWLRSRIRQFIWKRWKKVRTRQKNLKRLGMEDREAHTFACTRKGAWRTAHNQALSYTLTNKVLEAKGLINLSKTLIKIQNA
ncbi:group II intron reverse transcriptase/maturase [Companilactobacillus nantensis]|uniref:group II intron reverse transcriptase/maturase n=1 Tax=Companilactobacillus nantensis TaxID=305793 RepID=UPI00070EC240|nr:group II intron reverse transcriptase/maturase [Companilactobacillus nantensis]GEO64044.1 group II intron reverse transcriptase/maturase [Companilactobacillus nantensis]